MKTDTNFFQQVRKYPSMYLMTGSYAEAVALVLGFDLARSGGPLLGFREWLVVRHGEGANLQWGQLVLGICGASVGAHGQFSDPQSLSDEAQKIATDKLFELILEFAGERDERGPRAIYLDFQSWLEKQTWYKPDAPDWYSGS
jgi:hypothetical protein